MYSSSDFERLFIRYKAEAMPEGESIQAFCLKNKVPYNLFHKCAAGRFRRIRAGWRIPHHGMLHVQYV